MKKFLLLLCTLLASVGLWAERMVTEYQVGEAITSTEQISETQLYVVRLSGVSFITETETTYEAPNAQNQITDNALFYFEKNSEDNTYFINCKGTHNYWGTLTSTNIGDWTPSAGYPVKGFELTFVDGSSHVQMKSGDLYLNRSSGIMHGWASPFNYLEIYPVTSVTTTFLTFLEELDNEKAYVITNARGTWNTGDAATLTTTKKLDKEATSQQFAIINYNGQYYVYSVSAKAFLNPDKTFGDPAAIQITETNNDDYPNFFKFDDTHNVNVQGNGNVVIDSWTAVDAGNSNRIIEAAEFDPTEALNALYEFPYQKYLVKNVESGMYWGAANDWGTRASLVPNAEYLKLVPLPDGTYHIESQVNNGGTRYYFNGDYMDDGSPVALDIAKVENGYTIANGTNYFGWDGSSTVLGKNLSADSENAVWTIVSLDDAKEALADATSTEPADATFLIEDHNFGRNNRYSNKWTGTGLKKGGDNSNLNTESYMAAFNLSQTFTDIPNGIYKLEAQAAVTYHDNRTVKEYDGEGAPVIYANEESSDFKIMETADQLSSQSKMSTQFSAGLYQVEPVYVEVTDGSLTVGAKCERTDIWAVWDNFVLTFYGTDATIDQLKNSALFDKVAELREKVQEILDSEELEVEEVTTQLNDALAATTDVTTVEQAESAIETLQEAYDLGKAYVDVKDVLASRKLLTENTNVYTQEAYDAYYTQWYDKYVAATLTAEEANALEDPYILTGWQHNASTQSDDLLLSVWSIGGEKANDYEKSLYINTWSVEGESDGTDFKVPFFEYWTGNANSLGATAITAQLENIPAGEYNITAWVRVRAKNETAAADATGVTLKVTGGEDVDATEGEAVGQFNIAEYTAQAVVGEDGVLEISFDVAADNNVSWLSFQNVKYEKVEPVISEEPIGWWKFDNADDLLAPEPETSATLAPSTQAENKTIVLEKTLENANITAAEGPTADNGAVTVPVRSSLYMLANTPTAIGGTYSIMYDVKVADAANYTPLLQSDLTNANDGDLFISGGQVGVRTAGLNYHGTINADEWYRIMFVVEDGVATVYINGEEVGKSTEASDRWQLAEGAIFFCDENGEETEIQAAEIRLWNRALSAEEVAELGAIEGTDQSMPTPLGVWTFDDKDDLMAGDCTATLTSATHTNGSVTTHEEPADASITPIDGPASDNGAIKVPVGSSLLMDANLKVDNIGTYTVMWDVKAEDVSSYSPLLQNGLTNGKDGSFFIKDGQVGLGSYLGYHGSFPANEWHRIVLVVQPNAATVYIDGEQVGACTAAVRPYSEHWLLSTGALFFADNDGEEKEIQTAEIRFWDKALSAAQVAELGTIEIGPAIAEVTYQVMDADGNILLTYVEEVEDGTIIEDIPDDMKRPFTSYELSLPIEATSTSELNLFHATATFEYPFPVSTDEAEVWTNIELGENLVYAETDSYVMYKPTTTDLRGQDAYLWAIYGNPYEGFQFKNKGTQTTISDASGYTLIGDGAGFYIEPAEGADGQYKFISVTTEGQLGYYDYYGTGNGYLYNSYQATTFAITEYVPVEMATVTYKVVDADGNVLIEETGAAAVGDVISELPERLQRPFTTYTYGEAITIDEVKDYSFEATAEIDNGKYIIKLDDANVYSYNNYLASKALSEEDEAEFGVWTVEGNPYETITLTNTYGENFIVAMSAAGWATTASEGDKMQIAVIGTNEAFTMTTTEGWGLYPYDGWFYVGEGYYSGTFNAQKVEEPAPDEPTPVVLTGTFDGIIKQIVSHPKTGKQGEATDEQTVTIAEGEEEGTYDITFSGFTMPVTGAILPEFTITGIEAEVSEDGFSANYVLPVWAPQTITIDRGTGSVTYKIGFEGTKNGEDAPVLKLTLDNSVVDTVWFGADEETVDAAIEEDEATGINGIRGIADGATIFDISGRKVAKIQTGGIYIVNGKKVSIK